MSEGTREQSIRETLQQLSIEELAEATNKFLSSLEQRYPATTAPSSRETLISMGNLYFNEFIPLWNEWGRRQHADPNYQREKHFPLIQSLQGQMPVDLTEELTELRRRQAKSSDWDPEKDGVRLRFLQKIKDFYNQGGKLPFPLLNFCLNNGEAIRELRRSLWKKQTTEGLRPEEVKFLQFLENSGVKEILD